MVDPLRLESGLRAEIGAEALVAFIVPLVSHF